MKTCMCCGCWVEGRRKFCLKSRCQKAKEIHRKKVQKEWIRAHSDHLKSRLRMLYTRKLSLPPVEKVFSLTKLQKRLERPEKSIMERILDKWLNMFSDSDQVELIFLEAQHLRGSRDHFTSTVMSESGGHIWGGILPNRGGRS